MKALCNGEASGLTLQTLETLPGSQSQLVRDKALGIPSCSIVQRWQRCLSRSDENLEVAQPLSGTVSECNEDRSPHSKVCRVGSPRGKGLQGYSCRISWPFPRECWAHFCLVFVFLALLSEVSTFTLSGTAISPESENESSDCDPFLLVSEDCGKGTNHHSSVSDGDAAEPTQGPGLGASAQVLMFSSTGNLV